MRRTMLPDEACAAALARLPHAGERLALAEPSRGEALLERALHLPKSARAACRPARALDPAVTRATA